MLYINITFILKLICIIFSIELIGIVLNRKNILMIIVLVELLLLAVNLNFASFSIYLDDIVGQIFILFILTTAATESGSGIAIITGFYKLKNSIKQGIIKNFLTKILNESD
jgi:NADH:ubiquinone oxidoreductase subunit K